MQTGSFILTEGDDADTLAGGSNVVPFRRPELGDPISIGDLFALVVSEAAVRMVGNFDLPRLAVWAHAGEEGMSPDLLKEH